MKRLRLILFTDDGAKGLCDALITVSASFTCEPRPLGEWCIEAKDEPHVRRAMASVSPCIPEVLHV